MFLLFQYLLPHRLINALAGFLAQQKIKWLKNYLIQYFIKRYPVDLQEAENPDPLAYASFNDFFTRRLRPGARPTDLDPQAIVSPVDGTLDKWGVLAEQAFIQAKGKSFTLAALLANERQFANAFLNGSYAVIYLAPSDYHRVHMPTDGKLIHMEYVPGRLFSVQPKVVQSIHDVFAKNERLICYFETPLGLVAQILVGAMVVGSMETIWQGVATQNYTQPVDLKKSQEMGRFKLGSTVILLFQAGRMHFEPHLSPGSKLRLGQKIAEITTTSIAV